MIILDEKVCSEFESASSREWLETNGIGGFASGTVSGANSRRYHGLLTAATKPPLGRITMVSKCEETISVDGEEFELSSNQYPGKVDPKGFQYLKEFKLDPYPVWMYEVAGRVIEKRVFMVYGRNATVIQYRLKPAVRGNKPGLKMTWRPLLSFVDYHHLQQQTDSFDGRLAVNGSTIEMRPVADLPSIYFAHDAVNIESMGYWYSHFEYAIEKERGFDFREDLFQPFELTFDLRSTATIIMSTERPIDAIAAGDLEKAEKKRRNALVRKSGAKSDVAKQLVLAADQFIVKRGEGSTVIAGYPWFSDWGRDTMIALPGLTLSTGRPEIARGILREFAEHVSEGMIPNRFPDECETADYNTIDATLWYFEAVRAYAEKTDDHAFVRKHLYETLAEILAWHLKGTRFNVHVDTDGLLYGGSPKEQLTWMDAKIGDLVITPRNGKAVEIQALWYNALCTMADLAERFEDLEDRSKYIAMANLAKLSFNAVFWNSEKQCLYDVVDNGTRDDAVRPNQIFAASLQHTMLDKERARLVVEKVQTELLTAYGLRSLSADHPDYAPTYIGSPLERDSSYHQGTVWGWLIGGFIDAHRRVYPDKQAEREQMLSGFASHMLQAGLGQISEIFDADAPHHPRGCPAQAWSVAEVLRQLQQ